MILNFKFLTLKYCFTKMRQSANARPKSYAAKYVKFE